MFERFTEGARNVVVVAQAEARAIPHNYIGTEHLLLALLLLPDDSAVGQALAGLGLDADDFRNQIRAQVPAGEHPAPGQIPFTPRSKRVMEESLREALARGDRHIGPEHLLLALAAGDEESMAVRLLRELGIDSGQLRSAVACVLPAAQPEEVRRLPRRLMAAARRATVAQMPIEVDLSSDAQRLLMSAGARALDDGRRLIQIADIEEALRRRQDADDPPPQSATG